jgi:hypothetical protein
MECCSPVEGKTRCLKVTSIAPKHAQFPTYRLRSNQSTTFASESDKEMRGKELGES